MNAVAIESVSIETLTVTVRASADPTGTTPKFAVTVPKAGVTSPSTWGDGSWGSWDSDAKTAPATTPTLGASGADVELDEASTYTLWLRIGAVVQRAGTITVT